MNYIITFSYTGNIQVFLGGKVTREPRGNPQGHRENKEHHNNTQYKQINTCIKLQLHKKKSCHIHSDVINVNSFRLLVLFTSMKEIISDVRCWQIICANIASLLLSRQFLSTIQFRVLYKTETFAIQSQITIYSLDMCTT